MNPARVCREQVHRLTDLPNVGAATAADLRVLGIDVPTQLVGRDPWAMYTQLCNITGVRHDPCVIDVFMSLVDFANGGKPQPWWHYTAQRKVQHALRAAADW
jgi:hypothetical protein